MFYLMWQKKAYKRRGEGHGHPRTTPPSASPLEREKSAEKRGWRWRIAGGEKKKIEEERRRGWEWKGEEEYDGQEAMTEKDDVN